MMIRKLFLFSLAILAGSAAAIADAQTCASLGIENNVTANAGCQLGTTNNDFLNPLQVNLDNMFGFNDWIFAEKVIEDPEQVINIGLLLDGGANPDDIGPGTWSINNIWGSYQNVMLVFKGGGGNIVPTKYVGYLLVNGDTSGSYFTPFENGNNGNPAEISHVSAYVRVPEPTSALLLVAGLGLIGATSVRRGKR